MTDHLVFVTPSAVLDAVSRAIVATDTGGTVLYWNKAAERLYGWAPEEMLGRDVGDLLAPTAPEPRTISARVCAGEEWSGQLLTRHKDGHLLEVAVSCRPVVDDVGQVVAVVGEVDEVAADRRLQSELRVTRDEHRLALAAGRLGILRWDRETSRATLDETAETLMGLAPGTFDGTFETWVSMVHPDDRDRVVAMLDRAVVNKGSYDLEYRVVWPDGSIHWLQGRGQVTLDDDGTVTGRIGCMADISARRLADEERAHLLSVERSTRTEAETMAVRLRGLQAVTMSLIRAVDARSVAEAVLNEGVPALGGVTGCILLVADDGETVEMVHEIGYLDEVKERWRAFPLTAPLPPNDAIGTGEMVLVTSVQERDIRYPALRGLPMSSAVAVAPLIDEDGTAFGAMVVGFPATQEFSEGEIGILSAVAAQCATALRRAALFEAEREARLAAERAQERLTFLAEASSALASSVLDLETTLAHVVELAVPRLADGCAIQLVDDRGEATPVAVSHVDPRRIQGLRRLVEDGAGDAGTQSLSIVPLRSQSRDVGVITLVTETGRQFDAADLQLAEQLAAGAAAAIENARMFADRSRVARSLQASLLPPSLPSMPGLELGARYAPASEGLEVGGDFYDAFAVDGGRWLLVVGDVRGKGVDAAAVTGLARHTIRSIAMFEARPSAILTHLNRVLLAAEADRVSALRSFEEPVWELTEPRFCTVALAIIEPRPEGAAAVVCSGGHPLPLVARAGGTVEAVGRPGTLLGASAEIELSDVAVDLAPGDALVCFTDGIVERHRGRDFFDEACLARTLAAATGADAATLAARIEHGARNHFAEHPHDDMAVLIARVPPT